MMNLTRIRPSVVWLVFLGTLSLGQPQSAAGTRAPAHSHRVRLTGPLGTVPAAPSGLAASAVSSSQINLSWTDTSMNETSFTVERAMSSVGPWSPIGTTGASIVFYSDSGLAAATTCYYRVRATNGAGASAFSNAAGARTNPAPPLAPSGLTATAISASQINLGWTDNASNETGFKVERSTASAGWTQIGTTGTGVTSFPDTSVAPSTSYSYRVLATNAAGDSGYSNTPSVTTPAAGTPGSVSWAKRLGAQNLTDASYVSGVAVDASGNIFAAGRFTGTANLGGGNVTSGIGYDIFIAKYDSAGTYQWAKHFNSNNVQSTTSGIAVDGGGNVLVTGSFFNTLDFGAPCAPITAYSQDAFLVKLSSSGTCIWARNFTSNNAEGGAALAVDGSNNVVMAGGFQGTLDFGSGVTLTDHTGIQPDIYLAKFSSSGSIVWAHSYGSSTNNAQTVYDLDTDNSGNVVMTGAFQATVDFCAPGNACPLTAAVNSISGPSNDAFIAKYTAGGVAVWVKSFGEAQGGQQVGQAVAFDGTGSILASGYAAGDLNFGTGILRFIGAKDLYVVKMATDGTTTWARRYGATGYDQSASDLAVDPGNNVVIAGKTTGPVDFGSGPLPNPDGPSGRTNALALKLSPSGGYVWVKSSGDNWFQSARGVATDGSSNAVFGGVFASTIDFGTGLLSSPGTSTDCISLSKFGP